ncbi:MAG: CoB--CoM heterodisulfide reductase iron-sulfur subunit A family protein [Candidatus Cloacimonetes bacterium]|nr:CoB--CoM heterodisulfide reductase iron-sulfur subunit A family protein [Candidatus Cloacimonadota bacterium]MBL7108421.1 CoB--CoM heterodisulfide reductase iron-sulfur subunit A family protein [Candidatus Cloacimonadota bacterium]
MTENKNDKKIGVFVCHCGINIASTVDVDKLVEEFSKYSDVSHTENYKYMCSDPGQKLISAAIKKHKLNGLVIACCSPTLHENTFRRLSENSGLNAYLCEIANIREQCSWVHEDKTEGTKKAIKIVKTIVEKVRKNESLTPVEVPVTKKALVIGAGIAGMQAALDIADAGKKVILVEKSPSIGGHMAQLSETFPTLDCSQCILTPKMVDVAQNPNITLYTYSEIEDLEGCVGNFKVKIRKKARYIDEELCTGCGICVNKCPSKKALDEFNVELTTRPAIYVPFPQAVPNIPVIDKENCLFFQKDACRICEKVCGPKAIRFDQEDEFIEEEVGAIVVATGYDLLPITEMREYGYGKYKDVINGLQFERLLSASGPTEGEVRRPSDSKIPKDVVFIQCSGSRNPEYYKSYCSKICCMYASKHAMLYKHRVPDGHSYIFYIDIRSGGKGYEEFVQRAQEEENVVYLRGRPAKVYQEGDKMVVWGVDTLSGQQITIKADLVVLAQAIIPRNGVEELIKKLKIQTDEHGFLSEAHPKLRPVETNTSGIFLAGCAQAPRDIPETVAQASGSAAKALTLLSIDKIHHLPIVATVDEDLCSGCEICIGTCPYSAREIDEEKKIAIVNEVLCEGCGSCVSACPSSASQQKNFTDGQFEEMIKAILE